MMRYLYMLIVAFLFVLSSHAQTPSTQTASDIFLGMKKLKVFGSVLYIAAHPDDENTRLLTYLSNERLYKTAYLSLTRGEGGQNLIGKEQGLALGLIRTQELLAARRIDGAEQFFTDATDFGYSKTKEETLRKWNKDQVLKDMVWIIRTYRPQIMIARFPPDKRAGHGHHAASAYLAAEAFDAAADPNRYPEQLNSGVQPWKVKRLLWNTYNFGNGNTTSPDQLKINVGAYNTLLGKSYGEIASESRSQHKSQGFGVPRQRGEQTEYFIHVKGDSCENDIMDDVAVLPDLGNNTVRYNRLTDQLIRSYELEKPEKSLPVLIKIYRLLNASENSYWKAQKIKEVESLIVACSGLFMEAYTSQPHAVKGDSLTVSSFIIKRTSSEVFLHSIGLSIMNADSVCNQTLLTDQPIQQKIACIVPENTSVLSVDFKISIAGLPLHFARPVYFKRTDPVKGEIYTPVSVLPPFTIRVNSDLHIMKDSNAMQGELIITKHTQSAQAKVVAQLCWQNTCTELDPIVFANDSGNNEKRMRYSFIPPYANQEIRCQLRYNDRLYDQELNRIEYDHIPAITYFRHCTIRTKVSDVKISGKNIGYIQGAGDDVPASLREIGYHVDELTEEACQKGMFQSYDAVVIGIRAYNLHDWLTDIHPLLMDYVQRGGVLVVQYNTSNQTGPLKKGQLPYPVKITRNRVSEEDAAVSILRDHPVLNYPNKITLADFEGWVQERSLYEVVPSDKTFLPLLSMHDSEEDSQTGSLMVADIGKGRIVYTTLSFFRQLPEGVSGACRLFSNLLSKPLDKTWLHSNQQNQ
jgi:LmbE family N-acetylglucosaminyl deacetylase